MPKKGETFVKKDEEVNIDEFLPMPGAEDVVSLDEDDKSAKTSIFSSEQKEDMNFLEDENSEENDDEKKDDEEKDDEKDDELSEKDKEEAKSVIDEIDKEFSDEESDEEDEVSKVDSKMLKSFNKLIDDGVLTPFDDDKELSDYTSKDWTELIQANIKDREEAVRKETPKEFFNSLPKELQYAAMHVAKGGTDLKSVFKALSQSEEVKSLDVNNEDDQEVIARQYLQSTNFGEEAEIEEQIREWSENGYLAKKANQFKPKLDKMQKEILDNQLKKQEKFQEEQIRQKEEYMNNIYETLKPAELNGIKIDNKRQNMLWNELTTAKYESMGGKKTNLLGKLLEDYQFGEKPRYDLIAETLWLLQDPEDYKANIMKQAKSEAAKETAKALKTEEGRKLKSTVSDEKEEKVTPKKRRTLKRQTNIFKR